MTLVITSGEPAGIGPDIILKQASTEGINGIVLGDIDMLKARAALLNLDVNVLSYQGQTCIGERSQLYVQHLPVRKEVIPGQANPENAEYVLAQLDAAVAGCLTHNYDAMVTAPVCKSVICDAGFSFNGHTGYIAELTQTAHVVMLLACDKMRVALVTTHIPLSDVSQAVTPERVEQTIITVKSALQRDFGIASPQIMVAGLNPHAGENGYLGREEIDVIQPVISRFNPNEVIGPLAADTMFNHENCQKADAFIAMYHDQGLAVLKHAGFGQAANITLGLPITRTSVDHGTAFALAGSGKACASSLGYAIKQAELIMQRAAEATS